jgi:hypothetical protein
MIVLTGDDAREVPEWFKKRLRDIDTGLVCYYNRFHNKFCIDRVTKDATGEHQSNVMMIPAISERFLDELKGMDSWQKYGSLEAMRKSHEDAKAAHDAKFEADLKDDIHHAAMDNKRQLNEALTLMQRHNLTTPPQ